MDPGTDADGRPPLAPDMLVVARTLRKTYGEIIFIKPLFLPHKDGNSHCFMQQCPHWLVGMCMHSVRTKWLCLLLFGIIIEPFFEIVLFCEVACIMCTLSNQKLCATLQYRT